QAEARRDRGTAADHRAEADGDCARATSRRPRHAAAAGRAIEAGRGRFAGGAAEARAEDRPVPATRATDATAADSAPAPSRCSVLPASRDPGTTTCGR